MTRVGLDHPTDPAFTRCIAELLDTLDRSIPDPIRHVDRPFLMPIEGVYAIEGRGTVATGKIPRPRPLCPRKAGGRGERFRNGL